MPGLLSLLLTQRRSVGGGRQVLSTRGVFLRHVGFRKGALVAVAFLCSIAFAGTLKVEAAPIVADEDTVVVGYSEFADLGVLETWRQIDEGAFWSIPRTPPSDYYDEVDYTSALALRASLHRIISGHHVLCYSEEDVLDTWDVISLADASPDSSQAVIDIYRNHVFDWDDRQSNNGCPSDANLYNREHAWPRARGYDYNAGPTPSRNPAYTDCHCLFACDCNYNRTRNDYPFADEDLASRSRSMPTDVTLGRGGRTDSNYLLDLVPGDSWDSWSVWEGRRGDIARALFYMAIRYEGDADREADLELTDCREEIAGTQSDAYLTQSTAYMGLLSTLCRWHVQDPVDDLERRRNTIVYLFQGNRNPFVDHPEWVGILFSDQ